jgi:hypothetical protein
LWNAHDQEDDDDRGVDQGEDDLTLQPEEVPFFAPGKVQYRKRGNQIDDFMQAFPVPAKTFLPYVE